MTRGAIAALFVLLGGCSDQQPPPVSAHAIAEVSVRQNRVPTYPQPDTTYLSFSRAHGFQVNYLAPEGKAWLWYPGNRLGVPEDYKRDVVAGQEAMCWRHPPNSFNPVTRKQGGTFACESLALARSTVVSALPADPFALQTGRVPYTLDRCAAPAEFSFDRTTISC
ncbi:hypothetical protein [Salipiger marinus]|uniref:hypothetical protein n=1 Tax=Salipiger marinus TaxID=555512 RepID=UPI004058D77D